MKYLYVFIYGLEKEINTFIQQEHIKLLKRESQIFYTVMRYFYF